ncbi:hypothetical protein M086_1008, partial [Bacteroides fragilis str. S13 L11]
NIPFLKVRDSFSYKLFSTPLSEEHNFVFRMLVSG